MTLSNCQGYIFRSRKREKENQRRTQTTGELEAQGAGRGRERQHQWVRAGEAKWALSKATEEQLPGWWRARRQTSQGKKRREEQTSPSTGSIVGWGAKERLLNAGCVSYWSVKEQRVNEKGWLRPLPQINCLWGGEKKEKKMLLHKETKQQQEIKIFPTLNNVLHNYNKGSPGSAVAL